MFRKQRHRHATTQRHQNMTSASSSVDSLSGEFLLLASVGRGELLFDPRLPARSLLSTSSSPLSLPPRSRSDRSFLSGGGALGVLSLDGGVVFLTPPPPPPPEALGDLDRELFRSLDAGLNISSMAPPLVLCFPSSSSAPPLVRAKCPLRLDCSARAAFSSSSTPAESLPAAARPACALNADWTSVKSRPAARSSAFASSSLRRRRWPFHCF